MVVHHAASRLDVSDVTHLCRSQYLIEPSLPPLTIVPCSVVGSLTFNSRLSILSGEHNANKHNKGESRMLNQLIIKQMQPITHVIILCDYGHIVTVLERLSLHLYVFSSHVSSRYLRVCSTKVLISLPFCRYKQIVSPYDVAK